MTREPTRYERVSRRSVLKATAGAGIALILPAACGNGDTEVFAGALTEGVQPNPIATTAPVRAPVPTVGADASQAPATPEPVPSEVPATAEAVPTEVPTASPTAEPVPSATPETAAAPEPTAQFAVPGEMVISFTYTQGAGGKNERPYIAVWIENEAGALAETVSLWYQQQRRGARWLDHLDRWWLVDQARIVGGGIDDAAAISSATRQAGSYAVAWNGAVDSVPATPGRYFVCIEAAREEGPYSLIRQPFDLLGGPLPATALPNNGELSAATVRIDV